MSQRRRKSLRKFPDFGRMHTNYVLSDLKTVDGLNYELPDSLSDSSRTHTKPARQISKVSGFLDELEHLTTSNFSRSPSEMGRNFAEVEMAHEAREVVP